MNKDIIPEIYQLYVVKSSSLDLLNKDKITASDKIKDLRKVFNVFMKDKMDTLDSTVIKPLWREWNSRFYEPFANVRFLNATTHMSQASTFYNVFVDADDIFLNKNNNEAKRCIYTALTRTSNELHILI